MRSAPSHMRSWTREHRVLFVPASALVQELLAAKRALDLPRTLRKLDLFEAILIDDLGYVQQCPEEAEVLFTLLAERYERRSEMITSNLVFSQWERIFKDQMATAAAIDRLVHHAAILEFDVPSFRTDPARGSVPAASAPSPGVACPVRWSGPEGSAPKQPGVRSASSDQSARWSHSP